MNILYYCPEYYYRHGGRTHARGFFGALKSLPPVSRAFLYPEADPKELTSDAGTETAGRGRLWFLPWTIRHILRFFRPRRQLTQALIRKLQAHSCDTLVIRAGPSFPSISQLKRSCPHTLICLEVNAATFDEAFHDLPLRSFFQRLEVARFSRADAVVVVSSYLKDYLEQRGVAPAKILVNQNGVTIESVESNTRQDIRTAFGIPDHAFLLGYIGGMEPFRRLPEIIAYVAELRRLGSEDIYFIVVGDGEDMSSIKDAITCFSVDLSNSVKLVGWQDHSRIPAFLAAFDLAIFPFTNDYCSPLKLFEYLGYGVPAIGPDTPAVREVFEDGVHLRLVKQDGTDFSTTVMQLKNDPGLRNRMGLKGRELVLSEYTWTKNAERVVDHVQAIRTVSHGQA